MLRAERRIGLKRSIETRYYLASVENDAKLILRAARGHWSIENGLEWVLDIAFREDENRVRQGHAAENFAVLRHIALNLLKQASSATVGKRRNDSKPLGIEITCSRFFPFEMRLPYIYAV